MNDMTEEIKGWSGEIEIQLKLKKIIFIVLGFCLILIGGEFLIISAENIIILTGFSEAFFGFIIIAFVTNVEELTLVFKSIKKKSVEIGLGGMIGKLIWNLSFTYGISGIIAMEIDFSILLILNWLLLFCLILFYHIKSKTHSLTRTDGLILLVFFSGFIIANILATI
jgi:cation:H+ antiporter